MSKYANLRWKIADLEKALEEEKVYSKKLREDIEQYIRLLYARDNEVKELRQVISAVNKGGDNK